MTPIRVLLVDDQSLLRMGFRMILEAEPDLAVVGEASDGETAVAMVTAVRPDVVLMDVQMPGMDGLEATRRIAEQGGPSVLILTTFDRDDYLFAALRAGARGYLLKEASTEDIGQALRAVARGEAVFGARIADRVLAFFSAARTASTTAVPFPSLTDREREVLDLVARGLTNAAIAQRLFLSDKTVRNHVSNVFAKLHVAGRAEAVARARDAGLGT